MREFFKQQLESLYRTTGLLQYQKMSDMADASNQIKLLLDELEQVCTWFPLIPSVQKKRIISGNILRDTEFIGLNKKIVWKWLNMENPKYFPDQSRFQEITTEPAPPDVADKYLKIWEQQLAQIGNPVPRADGIKDMRIQQMKDNFNKIQCNHTWMYFGEGEEICNDCGAKRKLEQ